MNLINVNPLGSRIDLRANIGAENQHAGLPPAQRFFSTVIVGFALLIFVVLSSAGSAFAQTGKIAWAANFQSAGPVHLQSFDVDTGLNITDFVAPNPNCVSLTPGNPAVAVVGTTIYYTCESSGGVYITDTVTHADGGKAFTLPMPVNSSTASIVWDGTGFWVLQSVLFVPGVPTTTSINKYSVTGALLQTVNLPVRAGTAGQDRNALAVTPTSFVSDSQPGAPYDSYDLNGNLVISSFITIPAIAFPPLCGGLTFDGSGYIATTLDHPGWMIYDANGVFIKRVTATLPVGGGLLNTLSVVNSGPALSQISLTPTTVIGGGAVQGSVSVLPASATAATILLSDNDPLSSFPGGTTVTIPAGSTTANFTVQTGTVAVPTTDTISAAFNNTTQTASFNVLPIPFFSDLTLGVSSIQGGTIDVVGQVHLSSASSTPTTISLSSSDPTVRLGSTLANSVTIPADQIFGNFLVTAAPVTADRIVTITGSSPTGITHSAILTVTAAPPPAPAPAPGTVPPIPTNVTVWCMNASLGSPHIQAYNATTGQNLADFVAPNRDAQTGKANGRGIAVVGTSIYYSLAGSGKVYKTDTVTHTDGGVAFSTPLTGISALSWDGTALWVVPYDASTNFNPASLNVYQYSLAGSVLRTVVPAQGSLQNVTLSGGPRDGFAITPTGFVADSGPSGPYDGFDLNGNLVKPTFITNQARTSGITFDGSEYIVVDVVGKALLIYNTDGVFVRSTTVTGTVIPFGLEGVSVAGTVTGPAVLPEIRNVTVSPFSVVGGGTTPVTGMVNILNPAPAGGATIGLSSSNSAVAFPAVSTVTIPAGASSATFPVTTLGVAATSTSVITGIYRGISASGTLTVVAPFNLVSLTLNSTSVPGLTSVQGTITLSGQAAQSTIVTLTNSNPSIVTIPANVSMTGTTTAAFTLNTLAATGNAVISATLNGVTQNAILQVTPTLQPVDTVKVTKAELLVKSKIMSVEATSTSSTATLTVTVSLNGTDIPIAVLTNSGGGKFKGQFAVALLVPTIKVVSSQGGSAFTTVTLK